MSTMSGIEVVSCCHHEGGTRDCPQSCLVIYGDRYLFAGAESRWRYHEEEVSRAQTPQGQHRSD